VDAALPLPVPNVQRIALGAWIAEWESFRDLRGGGRIGTQCAVLLHHFPLVVRLYYC
jgi:hypothetical protein